MLINKKNIIILLLMIVFIMIIGYAAFATKLNIKGTSSISSNWNVFISNIETKETHGTATDIKEPTYDKLNATFSVGLESPGDYKIYTITITNGGTLDATLKNIKLIDSNNYAINYEISGFSEGDDILSGKSIKMNIKIMYNNNITSQPTNVDSIIKLNLNFVQNDSKAKNIEENQIYNFDYKGKVQTFTAPQTGNYQLEVWGSQGNGWANDKDSTVGGYGGYAIGTINLAKNDKLYISVGASGGWNGGGRPVNGGGVGGGDATSIQNTLINDGKLKDYENNKENIIIVAGGGGGSEWNINSGDHSPAGGSGGGFKGANGNIIPRFKMLSGYIFGYGGTQTEGGHSITAQELSMSNSAQDAYDGSFGQGGHTENGDGGGQGGGGYYGGGTSNIAGGGGGGSGYIGNSLLTDKHMACYNCKTSNEISIKTILATSVSNLPLSNSAKIGNGYARITFLGK